MFRNVALFISLIVPSITSAQIEQKLTLSGQNAEVLQSEKSVTVITPETIQVPSTCSRQVPTGEIEVCRNETRYRQECSWVPSRENCWNETDRVCRSVPRSRTECHDGPSRTVCREIPSREVCVERPTREVCTTRPDGSQHCTTVGGGTHCTTVGGGQTCDTVPGERVCREVSYTDTECDDVVRNRCETVPGYNDCRDIPYSERVCGMEMQYRTENYACTKPEVVNRTAQKVVKLETRVQILTNGLVEEIPMSFTVKEKSSQFLDFAVEVKLLREPKAFVVLKKAFVKIASVTEKEIILKGELILETMAKEMLPISFPTAITSAVISEETSKLVIVFEGAVSSQGRVDLEITHKAFLSRLKTIAQLKAQYPSSKIELGVVDNKAALSIDLNGAILGDLKRKNMKLKLRLDSSLNIQGEIMNAAKPETSKLYEGTFVKLE